MKATILRKIRLKHMNKAAYTWTKVAVIAERERKLRDKQNTKVTIEKAKEPTNDVWAILKTL